MDGESFDRLSVVVHRLREKASRRTALRLLLGGSAVAAGGLLVDSADARKKNKNKNKSVGALAAAVAPTVIAATASAATGSAFPVLETAAAMEVVATVASARADSAVAA